MLDPYLISGTNILVNKLCITIPEQLDAAEAAVTSLRIKQLNMSPLQGNFDFQHFCNVHKHIFQDLYDWAGEPRSIHMEKPERALSGWSVEYAEPETIVTDAESILARMNGRAWDKLPWEEKVNALSRDMADLWKVHAFREGNTRTTVIFCCDFAISHNIPIDRGLFAEQSVFLRDSLVAHSAVFKDVGDLSQPYHLRRIVEGAMLRGAEQAELAKKKGMTMEEWQSKIAREREKQKQPQAAAKSRSDPGRNER